MSDFSKEIQEVADGLDELLKANRTAGILPAKVTSVNATALTCDVEDADGNKIFDVKLRTTIDNSEDGKYYLPKLNSWVLIANIAHQPNAWAVVMWTEIDKFRWEVRPVIFKMDSTGFLMEKSSDTLAQMVTDLMELQGNLLDAIKLITVTCAAPGSPSTVPLNVASFTALDVQFANLKTRFENILKTS